MSTEAIRIRRSWVRCAVFTVPSAVIAALALTNGDPWLGLPFALLAIYAFVDARRSGVELTGGEVVVRKGVSTHRLPAEEIASLTREPWRRWDPLEILTFRTHAGRVVRAGYPWAVQRLESPALDAAYHDVAQWLLARQPDVQPPQRGIG
ncbi:MAG: hypothetical protein ACT4QG_19410 [Sporichthyaceae bacterium]